MVKVAVAGGSGNIGREIIDGLVAENKHDILILSRKDAAAGTAKGITWVKTNYQDTQQLVQILDGVHTVLSFIIEQETETSPIQRRLIDAAVQAGVKRFAPSEWASSTLDHFSWYAYKGSIREYLAELNKDKQVLEYTLFQPGLLTNYLTRPYKSCKHIRTVETPIDFHGRRAILVDGAESATITLTTVHDLVQVVCRAIDYEGEWPAVGGIQGHTLSFGELLQLGEKLRGAPFTVERIKAADFDAGTWEASWLPRIDHLSIPPEQVELFFKIGTAGPSTAPKAEKSPQRHAELLGMQETKGARRGTSCISQELPNDLSAPSVSGSSSQVEGRLTRVERVVDELINNAPKDLSATPLSTSKEPQRQRSSSSSGSEQPLNSPAPAVPRSRLSDRTAGKYEELSRDLLAAWPSEHDLDIINRLPVGLSIPLFWRVYNPYPGLRRKDPSPQEMLRLPPPGSHPVLIARRLLALGTYLQGVLPSEMQKLGDLGVSFREIMARTVDRAIRLVTTNEELIGCVEGIECIMLEAMYQNYAGQLHRAWMAARRAIAAAQMIGLHRHTSPHSLKFLEPETRAAFNVDFLCFRLVLMDRYLSLMLGLPQSALEGRFIIPTDLQAFDPLDRLERLHCTVSGRVVQRNDADINDLSNTREVDKLLQSAASEMPPQWWMTPTFSSGSDLVSDTIRMMAQFSHHHLLARLHLPYMLRSSSDHRYDHSKITAVNASREILARYIVFRTANPAHFYCRGCDFLAFVATTILCLAHLIARGEASNAGSVFTSLVHTRPVDRGMMERTAEIIESMALYSSSDAIAPKLTSIIRHLLDVEGNAADGAVYSTSSSSGDGGEIDGNLSRGGKTLHVHIPYFGTINFERGGPFFMLPGADDDWDLQGIDTALFDGLFQGIEMPEADTTGGDTWM
ncbi:hypothetical protein BDW62DRAFT_211905 [Aspergillus aurantiobrunneus]